MAFRSPFQHLCRQTRSGVQVTYELDVVATDYSELESTVPSGHPNLDGLSISPDDTPLVTPTLRGRLHLRMANVGQLAEKKLGASSTVKLLQITSNYFKLLQITSNYFKLRHIASNCSILLQIVANCFKLLQIASNCFKLLQITSNYFKLLQIT